MATPQPTPTYFTHQSDDGTTVQFREVQTDAIKSPSSETFTREEGMAVRQFWTPWTTRWSFVTSMLGYSIIKTSTRAGKKYISRVRPFRHLDYSSMNALGPGADYLWVDSITSMQPWVTQGTSDPTTGVALYNEALFSVAFRSRPYPILSDAQLQTLTGGVFPDESSLYRYCIVEYQSTNKTQTLPPFGALTWADSPVNNPIPAALVEPLLVPEGDLTVLWLDVPIGGINWDAWMGRVLQPPLAQPTMGIIGGCNQAPFGNINSPGGLFPAQSLVCLTPQITPPHVMPNGVLAYDVKFRFKHYPGGGGGANYFYRNLAIPGGAAGVWAKIVFPGGGLVYPPVDFTKLFVPP